MITSHLVFVAVLGLALLVVTGPVLPALAAHGWNPLDVALSHLAGYATGCVGGAVLVFAEAPGAVCWLGACGGYAAWMAGGYALWILRTVRG